MASESPVANICLIPDGGCSIKTWLTVMTSRAEFSDATKRKAMELCNGICRGLVELKMNCDQPAVEVDHIKRCEIEPDNSLENARPLCRMHHLIKTRMDAAAAKKGRKIRKETKASRRKWPPMPGTKASGWRHKVSGEWEKRDGDY